MRAYGQSNGSRSREGRGVAERARVALSTAPGTATLSRRLGAGGLLLLLSLLTLGGGTPALAAAGQATGFPIPASCPVPCGPANLIVRGADGNLWFSTQYPTGIGRVTPAGQVALFADPAAGFDSSIASRNMVVGSDGNVWYVESTGDVHGFVEQLGRITPSGRITDIPIPASVPGGHAAVSYLAVGADGNVWFTASTYVGTSLSNGFLARVTPTGQITEFGTPTAVSQPVGLTLGPDGNLWFTEEAARAIGRITPAGAITQFPMPASCPVPCGPANLMVRGADGNLWFSTQYPTGIGRVTPAGQVALFADPAAGFDSSIASQNMVVGSDGNVWYVESTGDVHGFVEQLGRITPSGQVTDIPIPSPVTGGRAQVAQLVLGADGNVWLTGSAFVGRGSLSNGFVARVTPAGQITEFGTPTAVSQPLGLTVGPDGNLWFTEGAARAIGRMLVR